MNLNKSEVLKKVMELSLHWDSGGIVNIGWLSRSMDSTPYYTRKQVKKLIEEGYLVMTIRSGGWCEYSCDPYPPLKGYKLTPKSKNLKVYSLVKQEQIKEIKKSFSC